MILQCSCCQNSIDTEKYTEVPAFCPKCGAVFIENGVARSENYCRACGKYVAAGASFCAFCGAASIQSSSAKTKKNEAPKDKNANMKLYNEWMKYADLPAESIKEITGNDLNTASHSYYDNGDDYQETAAASGDSSYHAAPFVGTTKHWRTADKIGAGVSSFLKNTPLLISLALNLLLIIIIVFMIRS